MDHPALAPFGLLDAGGLVGVLMMLLVYWLTVAGRADPRRPPALAGNLIGSLLVLASLWEHFNISAVAMETAWALVAAFGLVRWAVGRR